MSLVGTIKLPKVTMPSSSFGTGSTLPGLAVSPYTSKQFTPQGTATPPSYTDVSSSGGGGYATPAQQTAIGQQQKINADNSQFSDYLNNDTTLAGQLQSLAAQRTNALNSFLTNAQQAEIAYGRGLDSSMLPNFKDPTSSNNLQFTDASGNPMTLATALADPTVVKAATGNPFSAVNSIQQQLNTANQQAVANEAARGMLHSGAYGQHLGENQASSDQANYTALQSFLSALNSGYGSYGSTLGTIGASQDKDVSDALARIVALIQAGYYKTASTPSTPQAPSPDASPPPAAPYNPAHDFSPSPDTSVPANGYNSVQSEAGNIFTPVYTGSNEPSLEPKPTAANYGVHESAPATVMRQVLSGYSQKSHANLH